MGGHGHGDHHHAPYTVPKAEIYNNQVSKIRELNILQNELAKRGLKDPWIRNDVWRYNKAGKIIEFLVKKNRVAFLLNFME